ncbi:hypothetical protein [Granulicella tundricola]|uniref:Uncharacterized protein n=1 Tax=Granulicella tundricola (strain ATCC BAA-1859 / DSM 23138 / MP5ACTX9) TaxID=1198114 RepID=E8X2N7_GRATM|nr:hypothetical protein [Granulicella tundricola]ADW70334.1 hypothetical protein AciX9_3325 [Granulicella tundricola MP5ACTX9]
MALIKLRVERENGVQVGILAFDGELERKLTDIDQLIFEIRRAGIAPAEFVEEIADLEAGMPAAMIVKAWQHTAFFMPQERMFDFRAARDI